MGESVARARRDGEWQDSRMSKGSRQLVAVLALERVVAFDAATPWQVLCDHYEVETCAVTPGTVATTAGVGLAVGAGLDALRRADIVMVPGFEDVGDPVPEPALEALRVAHRRGARVVSICTGAFALAAAGLLDGRRATTHWLDAGLLAVRSRP